MLSFKQWIMEEPDYSVSGIPASHYKDDYIRRLHSLRHHTSNHAKLVDQLMNDRSITNHDLAHIHREVTGTVLHPKATRKNYGISLLQHAVSMRRKEQGSI